MGRVTDLDGARAAVAAARARGQRVALANGAFDLLHVGHVRYLTGAKALADLLVVGVNADISVRRLKGEGRPIVPEAERVEMVASLAAVDLVVLFADDTVVPVIEALRPDVHVKGTDYTEASVPERHAVLAYGGRVAIAGDAKEHSTTELIERLTTERR
jgi:rfaE bifunctional protein nucleotidyltransferase chain/domain